MKRLFFYVWDISVGVFVLYIMFFVVVVLIIYFRKS